MDEVIETIEPNWMHGWANSPTITCHLDTDISKWEWIYEPIPSDARENVFLLSYNNWPWVRYVRINDPNGNPSQHGALGGEYKLKDGTILKSRTGWSSRASAVNKNFTYLLPDYITEVSVKLPGHKVLFAGFNLGVNYLKSHPLFPRGCFLIRDEGRTGRTEEVKFTISCNPQEVKKPDADSVS